VEAAEHKEEPLTPLSVSPSNDSQTEGTGVLLRWLLRVSRRPTEGLATGLFRLQSARTPLTMPGSTSSKFPRVG
jgi:hypothetical protein